MHYITSFPSPSSTNISANFDVEMEIPFPEKS